MLVKLRSVVSSCPIPSQSGAGHYGLLMLTEHPYGFALGNCTLAYWLGNIWLAVFAHNFHPSGFRCNSSGRKPIFQGLVFLEQIWEMNWKQCWITVILRRRLEKAIIKHYFDHNFGSMSKSDLETLLFHLYVANKKSLAKSEESKRISCDDYTSPTNWELPRAAFEH